jgi:hypothetical protein
MSRSHHKLSLRKLHIVVVDLIILTAAIIEGVKYVLFLMKH